ncbi:uncharacterized protein NEMAJ01_0858 [Nematocida major]|uniref:uncharacterized protein n=1 Tax=Nematocida major TaxID=1912982 RepID=UPI002008C2B7|nr:uncharacterized protein NEMAJ01_0858 [Nematocida major]KAH9385962.1 hypothetical protein NEMAJ01_0858 [Nematocida major]
MVQGLLIRRKEKRQQKKARPTIGKYKKIKRACTPEEKEKRQIRNKIEAHLKEKSKKV